MADAVATASTLVRALNVARSTTRRQILLWLQTPTDPLYRAPGVARTRADAREVLKKYEAVYEQNFLLYVDSGVHRTWNHFFAPGLFAANSDPVVLGAIGYDMGAAVDYEWEDLTREEKAQVEQLSWSFEYVCDDYLPVAKAMLQLMSDHGLSDIEESLEHNPLKQSYYHNDRNAKKARWKRIIEEERQRRALLRERRYYAQSNMAGMLESRRVPSFGYSVPAVIQSLIGSFLHNVGIAPVGHPSRLPRVDPHFGPAAPYPFPEPPRIEAVGQTRKASAEASASSKRGKLNPADEE